MPSSRSLKKAGHAKMVARTGTAALVCILTGLLAGWSVSLVEACTCSSDDATVDSALRLNDFVFRGNVLRKLPKPIQFQSIYVIRVDEIFKQGSAGNSKSGNTIDVSDQIVITTGSDEALCGVELKVGANYGFAGYHTELKSAVRDQLSTAVPKSSITNAISIALCDFVVHWPRISGPNVKLLRNYARTVADKNGVKCRTGADCRGGSHLQQHYCDAGLCAIVDGEPCPVIASCSEKPCAKAAVAKKCSVPKAKCVDSYCGGCNALFLDATRTRVCRL